jgi:hypothetical protein
MNVEEAVATYSMYVYEEERDKTFKWFFLPYWQSEGAMEAEGSRSLIDDDQTKEVLPLAQLTMPAVQSAKLTAAIYQRRFAMFRALEALRLYASEDGALPEFLFEIETAPVPSDPVTGESFEYQFDGNVAMLTALPPGDVSPQFGARFEIRLEAKR